MSDYGSTIARATDLTGPPRSPLRVLHVVSHLPPDRIGGVGEVVSAVHRGLLARGHRSEVLTTGTSHDDALVHRVCPSPDRFLLDTTRFVGKAMEMDIVHFHHGEALLLLERLQRLKGRPRTVLTLHVDAKRIRQANQAITGVSGRSGFAQTRIRDPLKRMLDSRSQVLADKLTFISRAGAREMLQASDASEATVIYNSVPTASSEDSVAAPIDLIYVGTPGPRKGIDLLPGMLGQIRKTRPQTTLRIVGFDPSDEPDLVEQFDRAGCADAVEWTGPLPQNEIIPHYRSAKALIVPSRYEGLPMVVLEAGSVGLPSIATDVGGTSEAVTDRVTGLLVERAEAKLLAHACIELLSDNELQNTLSNGIAKRVADSFSPGRQVMEYEMVYRELVERADQN